MANGAYIGVNGVSKKIKDIYIGVGGVAKKVKKAYIGVNGIAKPCYSSFVPKVTVEITGNFGPLIDTYYVKIDGVNHYYAKTLEVPAGTQMIIHATYVYLNGSKVSDGDYVYTANSDVSVELSYVFSPFESSGTVRINE